MGKKIMAALLCLCLFVQVPTAQAASAKEILEKVGKAAAVIALVGQLAPLLGIGGKKSPEEKKKEEEEKEQKELDKAYKTADLQQVAEWAEKDKDPQAQCILSYAYLTGQGVAKDPNMAIIWQNRAADQNVQLVKNFIPQEYYDKKIIPLAELYALAGRRSHLGRYVKQSYDDAVRWSGLGANEKNPAALAYMGTAYYTGRGLPQNYDKAMVCLQAAGKDPLAMKMMSMAFRDGNGVKRDLDMSKRYGDYLKLVQEKKTQQHKAQVLEKYDKQIKAGDLYGIVR